MRSLCLLFALAMTACGGKAPPAGGRGTYEALNCKVCHRVGSEGGLGGPDLTYVGFRKSKAWLDVWLKDPQAWRPATLMPNPHLSDPARQAVVDYLSTLKGQDFGAQKPWDDAAYKGSSVERGHVIFAKAGCITCHGKGGAGGYPNNNVPGGQIPALTKVSETYTRAELIKKITSGSKPAKADPSGPDPLLQMPPWGQALSPTEIEAVADYVLSLGKGSPEKSEW
jgi:mono/diheme cytochrome c family protein